MLFRVHGLLLEMRFSAAGSGEHSRGAISRKRRLPGDHQVTGNVTQAQTAFLYDTTSPVQFSKEMQMSS